MQPLTDLSVPPKGPNHVAIIMDGNGRWANARGLPRAAGHRQGAEAVRRTVAGAIELGVSYLTLYGFSSENWKRPATEVEDLMGLLRRYLQGEIAELHKKGIRLRVIGERARLPADIVRLIDDAEARTAGMDQLDLVMAISYGGRQVRHQSDSRIEQQGFAFANNQVGDCLLELVRLNQCEYTAARLVDLVPVIRIRQQFKRRISRSGYL